jgi:transposase
MSNKKNTISRKTIGELPVCIRIAEQLGFQDVLKKYIPIRHNESLNAVDALMLLVFNMACGRQPLYKVADWVKQCDAHLFEFDTHCVNDDRFARALDKLYQADRASIMTDVVTTMIKNLDITCDQIHNDSTSLKTTGHVPGKTKQGLEMKRGHSKDHRPDLKQLVYSLSITCDGAVPVHMKTYSGNRTDDTTHIETWNTLTKILNKKDFLYVADCKLCTDAQLTHITGHHGRAITVVPKSWKETKQFMDEQKKFPKGKTKIWSRPSYPGSPDDKDIIYAFDGSYASLKHAYPIHWYYSSNKREKDALSRQSKMQQMEKELNQLTGKNGKQTLKTKTQLSAFIETRLNHYKLTGLYDITIAEHHTPHQQKVGR